MSASANQVREVLDWLERNGDTRIREEMMPRYGVNAPTSVDERNFVKKGVSWALRAFGRRNPLLNAEAIELSRRLAASSEPAARWVGKDALKELTGPVVQRKLTRKRAGRPARA